MKKASKVFKSIRFAKMDPTHDKGPKGSSDDEEHYAVSSQEYQQQVDHVKKRAMQEAKIKVNFKMPKESVAERIAREHAARRKASGLPDPSHYKQMAAQKQKEIDAMKEEVEHLEEGRPSQRHPLEGHEYHKKTNAELEYIAKDAHKAAEAMKGHNEKAENKYRDQANDSATVRYFRKKSGTPDWYKKKYGLNEAKEKTEYDYEGDMARGQLQSVINNAQRVHDMLKDNDNLPEWVQSKITLAEDYISTVANYMMSEIDEEVKDEYARKVDKYLRKKYGIPKPTKPVKPTKVSESVQIDESRKTQIVREAIKKAKEKNKNDDKFEPEPELNSQVQKVDNV